VQPRLNSLRHIGIDLDNTLIDYTAAYRCLAPNFDLSPNCNDRVSIRSALRPSGSDDQRWQEFQTRLYTEGLAYASIADGATHLFETCANLGIQVSIVSHKTRSGPEMYGAKDLWKPAIDFLREQGFVPDRLGLTEVHFAESLSMKIKRIKDLGIDAFIDDLPKVLLHPAWPNWTQRILYEPGPWQKRGELWSAGFEQVASSIGLSPASSRKC